MPGRKINNKSKSFSFSCLSSLRPSQLNIIPIFTLQILIRGAVFLIGTRPVGFFFKLAPLLAFPLNQTFPKLDRPDLTFSLTSRYFFFHVHLGNYYNCLAGFTIRRGWCPALGLSFGWCTRQSFGQPYIPIIASLLFTILPICSFHSFLHFFMNYTSVSQRNSRHRF